MDAEAVSDSEMDALKAKLTANRKETIQAEILESQGDVTFKAHEKTAASRNSFLM